MKEKKNKNSGITLISLIITIILLLILAGVSIGALTGENGILNQAQNAKLENEIASVKEDIELEIVKSFDNAGNYDDNVATERLKKNLKIKDEDITNKDGVLTINYKGYKVYVDTKGNVTTGLTSGIIASNPTVYYGKEVTNYECENSAGVDAWQIFYADTENIYLIASNKITYDYTPSGKNGTEVNYTGEALVLKNVYTDYKGSQDIINNKDILPWIRYVKEQPTRSIFNIKTVAYLLDTQAWNVFKGDDAKYAIGGPTVELFIASYNQRHPENIIEYETDINGYKVKWKTDEEYTTKITGLDSSEALYKKSMWIASPSGYNNCRLVYINRTGDLDNCDYNQVWAGACPVVCLNSDVELNQIDNENFEIK